MKKAVFLFLFFSSALFSEESVVCIHGFMRTPKSMKPIAETLEKEGFNVINWGYPSRKKSIMGHAEELVELLQSLAEEKPGEAIHFITHSTGGIITRAALNHLECPEEAKVGKAVLMAPPNQGSSFGRALGKFSVMYKILGDLTGRELLSEKNFLHFGPFPDSKKILIISGNFGFNPLVRGQNDGKVSIAETELESDHQHSIFFVGHSWMMFDTKVIHQIKIFLK